MRNAQQAVLNELIEKVQMQAKMVSDILAEHNHQNSVPRITSSVITLTGLTYGAPKNTKLPMILPFLGELPTPKEEAFFEPWIF